MQQNYVKFIAEMGKLLEMLDYYGVYGVIDTTYEQQREFYLQIKKEESKCVTK